MPTLTLHTAEILLPMGGSEPIINGGVIVDDAGRIVEAGPAGSLASGFDARHDHQVIMPGVLNCHVHLTDARRAKPVRGGEGLNRWVRELLSIRNLEDVVEEESSLADAVLRQLEEMRDAGTVAVGEVANSPATLDPLGRSGMRCRFIHELIGFNSARAGEILARALDQESETSWPANVSHTLGAHAPYSVSPDLLGLIDKWSAEHGAFYHIHLAEDPDERLLYVGGEGPWRDYLEQVGAWDQGWKEQGMAPVAYYDSLGLLTDRLVAVHLADATIPEVNLLASRGVRAILSPSSNRHITGNLPPLHAIVESGMRFAFGTDGRGSNASVDVFNEARILMERWSDLQPGTFLEALTSGGAEILQFEELGMIRPGACPGLLAVEVDAPSDDLRSLERSIIASDPGSRSLL